MSFKEKQHAHPVTYLYCSRENSSWVNPACMKKLIWACLPTTSNSNLEKLHLIHYVLLHVHCKQVLMPTYASKRKNQKWESPKHVDLHSTSYMMFRRRFDVSTKFTDIMSNHQTSSNLPRNSRGRSFWIVLACTDWITPFHFRRTGNSNFHGDRSKRTAQSQIQTVTPAVQPQKAKHSNSAATKKI